MLRKENQRGDTIIEVLISVAVLSLILAASFTLANRSARITQASAERAEASKYAQSEMERLKYIIGSGATTVPAVGSFFCITSSNSFIAVSGITLANIDTQYSAPQVDASCKHGTDNRYVTIVYRDNSDPDEVTYIVFTRWDSITGNGSDRINLTHKIYQPGS